MIGLIFDIIVIMALIRAVIGDDGEGFGKPIIVAIVAALFGIASLISISLNPSATVLILIGMVIGVGLAILVAILAVYQTETHKAAIIAVCFTVYKTAFHILSYLLFA